MLDSRPHNIRFLDPVLPNCQYLLASQCDPAAVASVPREQLWLWHGAVSREMQSYITELKGAEDWFPVPGGSTVILRAIPLLRILGFKRLHIYGWDSCLMGGEHHAYGQPKNDFHLVLPVRLGGREFSCHPWMVSQAREFITMVRDFGAQFELAVYGPGLIAWILEHAGRLRPAQGEPGYAAGVVLGQAALRRHPLRPRLASGQPLPLLHRFDAGGDRGRAGRQPAPPRPPGLRFGDVLWRGDKGTGYARVDWFTAGGLPVFGDGRLTVLGTDGHLEVRPNVDIAGRGVGSHLFLVDQKETRYVDCADQPLLYGTRLVDDVLNRTETAMRQAQCFLATELVLTDQKVARKLVEGTPTEIANARQ